MLKKTRKRKRVSRTQMNITWKKGEEEKRKRFEEAVKKTGAVANSVVRSLIDDWTEIVLSEPHSAIELAARKTAGSNIHVSK